MKTELAINSNTLQLIKASSNSPKKDSLETFSSLTKQIQEYAFMQSKKKQGELTITDLAAERFEKLQVINTTVDELYRSCFFQETDRMDCFEQGLNAIKSIHALSVRKAAKKSLEERKQSEILKIALQKEMNIIQKLADFLLQAAIPNELTPKKFQLILQVLVEIFFSIRLDEQQKEKAKAKKKDPLPSITFIQYCLMSGQRINLPWLIMLKLLQRKYNQDNLGEVHVFQQQVGQCVHGKFNKMIKMVISFIMSINDSHAIFRNLLTCLVDNIKQMELPIVPLFLTILYEKIKEQFKDAYLQRGPIIPAQLFVGKAIYSLENLNIICKLIKNIHSQMGSIQMQRQINLSERCSYCGLDRSKDTLNIPYQSIKINLSNTDQLAIRICLNCCHQLGIQPDNKSQLILFAPLILSKFWDWKDNDNLKEIKYCLNHLLIYHGYNPSKKSNKSKKGSSIFIAQSIAMNNVEEKVHSNLIETIYQVFLFNHSIVSIKDIIYEILNMLLICINSIDQKVKQKTLKMLNQPHIISFIFNTQQKNPAVYSQQVSAFRQKFIAVVLIKLRDVSFNIRVATLELLSSIYSREDVDCDLKVDFYQTIYRQIPFYNNPEYITKCVNIIDRSIFKLMHYSNQEELAGFVKIAVQTLQFNSSCLVGSKQNHQLKTQICKLNFKILQSIIDLTTKDFSNLHQSADMARAFNEALQVDKFNEEKLKSVFDLLIVQEFRNKVMDQQLIKNVPKITPAIIRMLIIPQKPYQPNFQLNNVRINLTQLINIVFQDIIEAKGIIFGEDKRKITKTRPAFNVKQLRNYFFSKSFFEQLISIKQKNETVKQFMLSELLSISNFCRLVVDRGYFTSSPLKSFLKGKNKWLRCIQFSNYELLIKLQQQVNTFREQMKVCTLDVIPFDAILVINITYFTHKNQPQSMVEDINKYLVLSSFHISKLISAVSQFECSQQKQANLTSILNTYSLITRALTILSSLVVSYEKIIFFDSFVSKAQQKQAKFDKKTIKDVNQLMQIQIGRSKASNIFQRCYKLVTEVLQIQFPAAKNNLRFQELFKSHLLLLNNYWQLHPELFLSSTHLLKYLLSNIDKRGFIKGVYKLFLSLLPCNDLRILSIINENFTASFQSVFDNSSLRKDQQMLQMFFKLLQHMLRSGMTSLCGMNRYVFCGLFHPCTIISEIANDIVKEIYGNEASEKMLFGNLNESMTFIYNFYFESQQNYLKLPQLSSQQIQTVKKISYITRSNSKCLLVRQKRDLSMKPSFIKKISEILTEKKRIIHDNPAYLVFLLKIIKAQESFDFCELYEILFAVNKISTDNFSFMSHLQIQLQNNDQLPEEKVKKSLRIYLAYRDLLSCLAYLSAYQPVQRQLANYNKLFQSSTLPYISLKIEVPLSVINLTHPISQLINIISDDVDTFLDILAGAIECIHEHGKRSQLINRQEDDGSNTNTTKPKGKRSKGKKALNQKGTKNGRKMCVSVQKRPRTRACVKQQSQTSNCTSFGTSEESIY